MKEISKETLIEELRKIKAMGWIKTARAGNVGGVGNTLEDLLGIKENNLPIPNANEWEMKSQRAETTSLITLFHMEPSPRALKLVPSMLLPKYGWSHKEAGLKYSRKEMSFRQTIPGEAGTDRGFKTVVNRKNKKVVISFDAKVVNPRHSEWLISVERRVGLGELNPQPYWGFDDLFHKAGTKLINCFYVVAETKTEGGHEFFHYNRILILKGFSLEGFLTAIEDGNVLVDFDARTGHNHGTKFRLRQNARPSLFADTMEIS